MSGVTLVYPKTKLAGQLREAGGVAVADAVQGASDNLAVLKPRCLTELQMTADSAMTCFHGFPAEFAPEPLQELYAIAARAVGMGAICGAPGADAALVSLCDLLDRLGSSRRWDKAAIGVHVQTLQLLAMNAGGALDAAATDSVLAGLRKVSARYLDLPPAAPAA
jgi:hypothetical protein